MTDQAMWNSGAHIDSDNQYRYEEVVNNNKTFIGQGVKVVSGKAEWDANGNVIMDNRVFAPNDKVVSYQDYMMNTNPYASGDNKERKTGSTRRLSSFAIYLSVTKYHNPFARK